MLAKFKFFSFGRKLRFYVMLFGQKQVRFAKSGCAGKLFRCPVQIKASYLKKIPNKVTTIVYKKTAPPSTVPACRKK